MPAIRNQPIKARRGHHKPARTAEEQLEEIADQLNKLDELDTITSKLEDLENEDIPEKLNDLETAIEEADVSEEVAEMVETLGDVETGVEEIKDMLATMMYNSKAARSNEFARNNPDWNYEYQLLRKTTEGNGLMLAYSLFSESAKYVFSTPYLATPGILNGKVGSVPSYPEARRLDPETIREDGLALAVIFYNDDFGMRAQDPLKLKRKKWLRWLCC
ncbi:hypothetical protein V5O48_003208 [Marasmius crinis-equi]|uniref:Uncharacterized protein n=1 Tax=Marasmius crinis-equi TaxID=585013 RepID=A0ABR3FTH6_9AGAR